MVFNFQLVLIQVPVDTSENLNPGWFPFHLVHTPLIEAWLNTT